MDHVSANIIFDSHRSNYDYECNKNNEINDEHSKSLYLTLKVSGIKINCLIDTGSTLSIIHPQLFNSIQEERKPVLSKTSCNLRMADGRTLKSLGAAILPIQTPVKVVYHELVVADVDIPMIIGFDFLSKHKCVLNLGERTLQIDDSVIPCKTETSLNSLFKISVKSDVEIPPLSECIVNGEVNGGIPHKITGLIGPVGDSLFKKGCLVARAVVNPTCKSLPVRVANFNSEPIKIFKNTIVGECELINIESVNDINESPLQVPVTTIGNIFKIADQERTLPEHLQSLFERSSVNLNQTQQDSVFNLLLKYQATFSKSKADIGRTNIVKHKIDTGDKPPFKMQPRRLPFAKREAASKEIKRLLEDGIIEPSNGPYASPIVVVTKPDKSTRLCIDYRRLNADTVKDSYPLPVITDSLNALGGSSWFSSMDLSSGYYQVEMDPKDKAKTAFTSHEGLYQFKVMSFGLCNAVATFERLMENVLKGLHWKTCILYIDDIITFAPDFDTHIQRLESVLERITKAGLKISPQKCSLFQKQVKFLGHLVSKDGIATDPEKINCVKNWPQLKSVHDVRSFLGTCSYYRRYISKFSDIARPLNKLTEKHAKFEWNEECQTAFETLKEKLTQAPVLAYPNMEKPFILDTDASGYGLGAVLSQIVDGIEKPIAFFSRSLNKHERNYCVTRRELLAVIESVKHFHYYLYGSNFKVRTDHGALSWLRRFKNPEGQIARWLEVLESYNFTIEHRAGKLHGNADGLSRQCIPCTYCTRHENKDELNQHHCFKVSNTTDYQAPSTSSKSHEHADCWLIPKSEIEIRQAQRDDDNLKIVITWLEKGSERPKWSDVSVYNTEVKTLWGKWNQLRLINGILYRNYVEIEINRNTKHLVVPKLWVPDVLRRAHDDPSSGHLGIEKTKARIKRKLYWPNMSIDIELWCKNCTVCQARRPPLRKARGGLGQYAVGIPMERVGIDLLGPLPQTKIGNKYILVVTDYFTRWVEAYPIPDIQTETITNVFIKEFITRYGIPRQVHTDRGTQFTSSLFKEICHIFRIDKTFTTAFHPQSDGLVERFNRTLEEMLSKVVSPDQKNWDDVLPLVLLAYRSSKHESTGFPPSFLMFGREVELPLDLLFGLPREIEPLSHTKYVSNLRDTMNKINHVACEEMAKAREKQKRNYDIKINKIQYQVGSLVWLHDPTHKKGLSRKLKNPWEGPYLVTEIISDLVYKIKHNSSSKSQIVHHDRLKLYVSN